MVSILDYGMGNLGSILNMVNHVGGEAEFVSDPEAIACAEKIILPGVGNFQLGMSELRSRGFAEALDEAKHNGAWILGICLGMQLMTSHSEEGDETGLGWFDMNTVRFPKELPAGKGFAVPHMGWNSICESSKSEGLFGKDSERRRFYFVHSYYVDAANHDSCISSTSYGGIKFASAIRNDRVIGMQFHPEKSHIHGKVVMKNFVDIC